MKKYLFLIAAAIALGLTSCGEENCDHDLNTGNPATETKTVAGSWYEEAQNEEMRMNTSGTFYNKYCNRTRSGETEGRWEYDPTNERLTWTYSFMGQTQFIDWSVKLADNSLTISSNKNGTFTYEKIVESYQLQVGDTKQITFAQTTGNAVVSYTSRNPRLASVKSDGQITAEGEKGTTYIKVQTRDFNVWVKVVVGDDCLDLWYDYPSLMGMDYAGIKNVLGAPSFNGDDGYSYQWSLSAYHDYLTYANVCLDKQTGKVNEITLALNNALSESELLTYLKAHYYEAPTVGDNYYTTSPDVENSAAVLYYDKDKKQVDMAASAYYVLADYTSDFGLRDSSIVKRHGDPAFGNTGYYMLDNYYARWLVFNYDKTSAKVTAYSFIINDGVSAEAVKALLAKKYKLFKESDGQFGYRDADTKEDSKVLVVYNVANQMVTVYDLRNFA